MTNEEYKNKNKEFINQMILMESDVINSIKSVINDISLPRPSFTFATKINELFDSFESDDKPLDQHLTVIIISQYLLSSCLNIFQNIDSYVRNIYEAVEKKDNHLLSSLIEIKSELEKSWLDKDNEILNFDFQNDLEKLLNSGLPLPNGLSKEDVYKICINELKRVNYQPKIQNITEEASRRVM